MFNPSDYCWEGAFKARWRSSKGHFTELERRRAENPKLRDFHQRCRPVLRVARGMAVRLPLSVVFRGLLSRTFEISDLVTCPTGDLLVIAAPFWKKCIFIAFICLFSYLFLPKDLNCNARHVVQFCWSTAITGRTSTNSATANRFSFSGLGNISWSIVPELSLVQAWEPTVRWFESLPKQFCPLIFCNGPRDWNQSDCEQKGLTFIESDSTEFSQIGQSVFKRLFQPTQMTSANQNAAQLQGDLVIPIRRLLISWINEFHTNCGYGCQIVCI